MAYSLSWLDINDVARTVAAMGGTFMQARADEFYRVAVGGVWVIAWRAGGCSVQADDSDAVRRVVRAIRNKVEG